MAVRRGVTVAVLAPVVFAVAAPAAAQVSEVELDSSPASELYVKRRPPLPESPGVPKDLEPLLLDKEKARDAKRKEAIGLLEEFLRGDPSGDGKAEALFKLAELLWEDARRTYVIDMTAYQRAVERCRQNPGRCKKPPAEPTLDFARSEKLYKQILDEFPDFRRADLVLYLVGFAAREAGRPEEALGYFEQVIERFPDSPLTPDAWMMIGENHFALGHWDDARKAYAPVLERPDAPSYDLALFKTAWCDWKLGDTKLAAQRFKKILDLAEEAERSGTQRERKRRTQLRDEALDYLVLVFTEDESVTAKDVYDFLASIGGERYSRAVLLKLANLFFDEASYERSTEAYRFLIGLDPAHIDAAGYQRRIVEANLSALDYEAALAEVKVLTESYGPESDWAKANDSTPKKLDRSYAATERLVRTIGKDFHARAQQDERKGGRPDLQLFKRAEAIYGYYLAHFAKDEHAVEIRFLRAEILFFKLEQYERAGDEYLAVGKTAPVGKLHKDALLKAMAAFEKARPANIEPGKGRELLPVDRKFAEATDLYATLFPADPEIVSVIFRNGQLFYDYGDYDEAVKRFGVIVTKYPDHPDAGAAGDMILEALVKAEDFENIERWARKLKKAKAFKSRDQQARLDRIIVEAINKSGDKYGAGGHYEKAAGFYLRIPKEYPRHELAPKALYNAAVMLEKAKKPEDAAEAYLTLADRYPKSPLAEKSAFTAGRVYEDMAYFEQAAEAYELAAAKFPGTDTGADALFNAGVLRQALGQHKRAIAHYAAYAKRYRKRKDASEVAFRIGVVYEDSGDDGRADRAFRDYAKTYRRDGNHLIEAHTRAGRTSLRLGHEKRAANEFEEALKIWNGLRGEAKERDKQWAAEARYHQGELVFRRYAAITLDVKPRKLKRTLDQKTKLLEQAMDIYLDVVEFSDAQWGTAALYRIGQIFEEFASAMQNAPVPPGLSEEEAEVYRMELDNYVIEIEERAIELYTTGYDKALELGVYNRYTKLLREGLSRMAASKYPPENETREPERLGDRPPEIELVKEVKRDD